jgi:hypothetical protein
MSKWTLEFEENEVEPLVAVLDHGAKCNGYQYDKDIINIILEKTKKTIKNEKYIKHHVFLTLANFGSKKYNEISETDDLRLNLNLTMYSQRALRTPFQKILEELNSQNRISVKECDDLTTVADCVSLIRSKK